MPFAQSIRACLELTRAISRTQTASDIYGAALDALASGLGVERASILLFDPDGVMRFKAWRGLSDRYRAAVEGHTPWRPDSPDPQAFIVADVYEEADLAAYRPVFDAEGIRALGFIPLVSLGKVIGKFMLYYPEPTTISPERMDLAGVVAAQVAFALERTRTEDTVRASEERLRFALDAALMGTWDWDLETNAVTWSDNLERIHGLPPGSFDGTFESYAREIHPDDRDAVAASIQRAIRGEGPHEVEYRLVAPDGSIRWAEGKGRVVVENGRAARITGVCMIVTRRKEAELARLDAAHEAARLKDEFLATLSHELRTPLNAILGWVQMLNTGITPAANVSEALGVIDRNARLQAQLIEDILDVSRIISGKLQLEQAVVPLTHLLVNAVNTALPSALAKKIRLSTACPEVLPPVRGDGHRLQQVLGNVLANAVKFTDEGGSILVSAAADQAHVRIEVRDTGVGIPSDFLPFVFDRFRQADSKSTRRHGGLGLGLAIARHIVELHGGHIEASSAGADCGTTIRITLPAASAGIGTESETVAGRTSLGAAQEILERDSELPS